MKRILVPCDFSAPSREAITMANAIATETSGEVTLFHTIGLPSISNSSLARAFESTYMKDEKAAISKKLEDLGNKHLDARVKSRSVVEFGNFFRQLSVAARSADMIVMGSKGASGIKEYTIGSNAEKVIRSSDIPVMVVKKGRESVKNIVFPVDPDLSQDDLVTRVKQLQHVYGAKLHLLVVNTPAKFSSDSKTRPSLNRFAKKYMLKNSTVNVYNETDVPLGIVNFSKEIGADLVAMRTHGRKGFAHLAMSSIAEDVANRIECPVWIYKVK